MRVDWAGAIIAEDKEKDLRLGKIRVGGEDFTGIGYQGLMTVNTKTYVEEPTRANDGSIPNINDHDTFIVPRCKVNFKFFNLSDYQRLCRVISSANEFYVEYFDKQFGKFVKHKMYAEPEEMAKIYNVSTSVIGVLDYEVSFIGTLNDLEEFTVNYDTSSLTKRVISEYDSTITYGKDAVVSVSGDETKYYRYKNETSASGKPVTDTEYWIQVYDNISKEELVSWGNSIHIASISDLTNFYVVPKFKNWNTRADGNGLNILPNSNWSVFENTTIYPIIGE
jgi:hypothetical protein